MRFALLIVALLGACDHSSTIGTPDGAVAPLHAGAYAGTFTANQLATVRFDAAATETDV